MNSIFNEQPSRKITEDFIEKAVGDASITYVVSFFLLGSLKHEDPVQTFLLDPRKCSSNVVWCQCVQVHAGVESRQNHARVPRVDDRFPTAALER